jgi:hypothetical protein
MQLSKAGAWLPTPKAAYANSGRGVKRKASYTDRGHNAGVQSLSMVCLRLVLQT